MLPHKLDLFVGLFAYMFIFVKWSVVLSSTHTMHLIVFRLIDYSLTECSNATRQVNLT